MKCVFVSCLRLRHPFFVLVWKLQASHWCFCILAEIHTIRAWCILIKIFLFRIQNKIGIAIFNNLKRKRCLAVLLKYSLKAIVSVWPSPKFIDVVSKSTLEIDAATIIKMVISNAGNSVNSRILHFLLAFPTHFHFFLLKLLGVLGSFCWASGKRFLMP